MVTGTVTAVKSSRLAASTLVMLVAPEEVTIAVLAEATTVAPEEATVDATSPSVVLR